MDPNQPPHHRSFPQNKEAEAFQYRIPFPPPQEPPRMDPNQLPYPSFTQNTVANLYRLPQEQQDPPRIRSGFCFRATSPENSVQGSPFPADSDNLSALQASIARLCISAPYNPGFYPPYTGVNQNDDYLLTRARGGVLPPETLYDEDQLMMVPENLNPRRNGSIYYNSVIGPSIPYPGLYPTRPTRMGSISIADHPYGNNQGSTFTGPNQLIRRGVPGAIGDYATATATAFGGGGNGNEFRLRDQYIRYINDIDVLGNFNRVVNGFRGDYNTVTLEQLRGRIVYVAREQPGCRVLQKYIEEGNQYDINLIFEEVIEHVGDLMIDPSGNYVIQKLAGRCSGEQRTWILRNLIRSPTLLIKICLNAHGTRAVQKLLENLTEVNQFEMVVHALSEGVVSLAKNTNGHHVLQHCLENFPAQLISELLSDVVNHCVEISIDQCGCCVMQHCIKLCQGELGDQIVEEIIMNALLLCEDKYGNYVVQYLLGMRRPNVITNLLMQLKGNYVALAGSKYGSHVVEKCLKEIGGNPKDNIIMELLRSNDISMLLMDPYANYVMQIAIDHSEGYVLDAMQRTIGYNTPMMSSNKYGKKVLDRLVARLKSLM